MACAICRIRRPRRFCPGVGDICTLCCGTERENTVTCPVDCEYLREAHKHEKPLPLDPQALPNRDVAASEELLSANEGFLSFLGSALGRAALSESSVTDLDVREALDAAIRTQRTLQSGLFYESVPTNPLAAGIFRALLDGIAQFREREYQQVGVHKTRDSMALAMLVFLQHFELTYNNGRPRSRAFLDALIDFYPLESEPEPPASSSLILP